MSFDMTLFEFTDNECKIRVEKAKLLFLRTADSLKNETPLDKSEDDYEKQFVASVVEIYPLLIEILLNERKNAIDQASRLVNKHYLKCTPFGCFLQAVRWKKELPLENDMVCVDLYNVESARASNTILRALAQFVRPHKLG